jgi:intraflagellar transport protein 140
LEAQLAMVAIQLDMPDEAKALYEDSKRYDLLNKMFQANGEPDNAIEVAEKYDRINLKNTFYSAAKYYEAANNFQQAIELYEKAGTHTKEVPRMLLEAQKLAELEDYVEKKKDKELYLWLGQYKESIGYLDDAISYYEQAGSSSNLVRLHLSQNQLDAARKICNTDSEPQACFLLARYL